MNAEDFKRWLFEIPAADMEWLLKEMLTYIYTDVLDMEGDSSTDRIRQNIVDRYNEWKEKNN